MVIVGCVAMVTGNCVVEEQFPTDSVSVRVCTLPAGADQVTITLLEVGALAKVPPELKLHW